MPLCYYSFGLLTDFFSAGRQPQKMYDVAIFSSGITTAFVSGTLSFSFRMLICDLSSGFMAVNRQSELKTG